MTPDDLIDAAPNYQPPRIPSARYVVLNPIRAGLCAAAGNWRWSSYPMVMGHAKPVEPLAVAQTLALFGSPSGPAGRAYARFVPDGVGVFDPQSAVRGQVFFGDEDFIGRATRHARSPSREVPR